MHPLKSFIHAVRFEKSKFSLYFLASIYFAVRRSSEGYYTLLFWNLQASSGYKTTSKRMEYSQKMTPDFHVSY